jgi:hypothetical protein
VEVLMKHTFQRDGDEGYGHCQTSTTISDGSPTSAIFVTSVKFSSFKQEITWKELLMFNK